MPELLDGNAPFTGRDEEESKRLRALFAGSASQIAPSYSSSAESPQPL